MKKILALLMAMILCVNGIPFQNMEVKAAEKTGSFCNTGKTYYVDADNGDDNNSGLSEKEAWQSIRKVNSVTYEPGDAILFKRGCVWTDVTIMPKGSGDANNQNYISCYGDETKDLPCIITQYSDEMEESPIVDTALQLRNQNYWTVEKLNLTNASAGSGSQRIISIYTWDVRSNGVQIKDCILNGSDPKYWDKISNSKLDGIAVEGFIDNLLIENNQVSNVKGCGININGGRCGVNYKGEPDEKAGKGVVVRNNYLENIGKDGIYIGNCYEPLVEYNVVNKSHSYAKTTAHVALWPFSSYGALFQYNEAFDTKTTYDGSGYDCDYECYNTTFQYNYSHDNEGGFMLIGVLPDASWMPGGYSYNVGSTVRYNISENDCHRTFTLTGGAQDTKIYNNTIYVGRNLKYQSNYFYTWNPGANKLTGLCYADDILVANNLFYSDMSCGNDLTNCSNVVFKNNMFAGRSQSKDIQNGMVTYQKNSDGSDKLDADGNKIYGIKEASGNIWGYDPLFVNPGRTGNGRENCQGYYLYEDSKALGNGTVIDEKEYPCMYSCKNDFYGNPIDQSCVNIGAYQGKGITRPKHTFDGKYEKMLDFEMDVVGENGKGQNGVAMSGVERCVDSKLDVIVTDKKEVQNTNTSSTKCLAFQNTSDKKDSASATFYLYESEFVDANGIRLWVDPNGEKVQYTVEYSINRQPYKKTFLCKEPGWTVIPFDGKYADAVGNTVEVTSEQIRKASSICIYASLPAGKTAYVDDIQINKGQADTFEKYTFAYDNADTKVIEDFETESVSKESSRKTDQGGVSYGPAYGVGIAEHNGGKAFYALAAASGLGEAGHYFNWERTLKNLCLELQKDSAWEGIQMNVDMQLEFSEDDAPLSDEDMKKLSDNWNLFNVKLSSSYKVPFDKIEEGGITQFSVDYNNRPDANGIVRIPFDKLYYSYKEDNQTKKVYLKDLGEENVKQWKENINCMNVAILTQGLPFGKSVRTIWYMDDISLYKNVAHVDSDVRVAKEPTCTEEGVRQKICPNCGDTYNVETIPALGHTCEWVTVKEATLTESGEQNFICTRCGEVTDKKEIPKLTTENPTEDPGENSTEKPTEIAGGNTTETTGGNATEKPTESTGGNTTEKPTESTGGNTTEKPTESTGGNTTEKPTEVTGGNTTEKSMEVTDENSTEKPTEIAGGDSTENPVEISTAVTAETAPKADETDCIVAGSMKYRIICDVEGRREVAVTGTAKANAKKIVIPKTVKINGKIYKVTMIYKKAFWKNQKVTDITIGKNVEVIGKEAFYGCSKLKMLRIKTKKLTKKSVQSKAFAKGNKKMKVTVPKNYSKSYKKLLRAKGMNAKAVIR